MRLAAKKKTFRFLSPTAVLRLRRKMERIGDVRMQMARPVDVLKCLLAAVLLMSGSVLSTQAQSASVRVELDPQHIPMGGTARLVVTVEGALQATVTPPTVQYLEIASCGSHKALSIVNGAFTRRVTYFYQIEPLRE